MESWQAEKPIDSKLLAAALAEVGGDEETWYRGAALFAFALEIGVSEERFRQSHPGARLDDLSSTVLAALRKHVAGVNLWCGCFGDQRETGIVENNLFGGGSSPDAKKITCEQAASFVVASVLPAKSFAGLGQDQAKNYESIPKAAADWEKRQTRGRRRDLRRGVYAVVDCTRAKRVGGLGATPAAVSSCI